MKPGLPIELETIMELADQSLVHRMWAYVGERFPLGPYVVLVAVFFGSAVLVAGGLGSGTWTGWLGGATVLLVFFHLRVFDEFKDFKTDREAYPDRVLSRGIISLQNLAWAGAVAITLELACSALIGSRALVVWAGCFVFTLLMRWEFFLGKWLRDRLVLYAISHNPIVGGLALYGWACTGALWVNEFWWYVGLASFGSLGFEVGRKLPLPEGETSGVDSYSSVLGRKRALAFLFTSYLATAVCLFGLFLGFDETGEVGNLLAENPKSWLIPLPLLVGIVVSSPISRSPGKRVELGASLHLLCTFILAGLAAW